MSFIRLEQKEHVAVLTLNRPEALNALNSAVLSELGNTLEQIAHSSDIYCLIITGEGTKSFVAGADIAEMSTANRKQGAAFSALGNSVFHKIALLPMPVIAAVNGFALGGGCELALACDFRICSENALFGQPEVGLGIIPGFGGTQRLARLVGTGMAKQMIFSAVNISAEEALRIGLVNAVYPSETLMDEAMKLASRIAAQAPIAVRKAKHAINEGMQTGIEKAIAIEVKSFADCFETADQREGMSAFLEKRKEKHFQNK